MLYLVKNTTTLLNLKKLQIQMVLVTFWMILSYGLDE
ncbi:hypothetical protein V462_11340 [Pantoea ananatis 15320]|nr:hypothetical protein V462_11340 [Pantoea ananatis 15320]